MSRILDRLRERELFRTITPDAFPVGTIYSTGGITREDERPKVWRITRHKFIGYSAFVEVKIPVSTIIYGVPHKPEGES